MKLRKLPEESYLIKGGATIQTKVSLNFKTLYQTAHSR